MDNMKKVIVLSLGGSLIIPEKSNFKFLDKFVKTLRKNYKTHKFVVVCGGGSIARKYIDALKKEGKSKKELSMAGIRATRTNAQFVMQLFGKSESNDILPKNMQEIKSNLSKNNVVICGALRYTKDSTSDSTAAALAKYLNSDFINLTNVDGLYDKNPVTDPKAKFIPKESWKDFQKRASKIKFKAGQHFVLDQKAAQIISKHKITTYIIGPKLKNLNKALKGKKFKGTIIQG
ncbi:UMP kinase [Candidatus Pacearchaeota archaeon]|nr:UMP kinase [Candidatus Pacearchaeota archaeon]